MKSFRCFIGFLGTFCSFTSTIFDIVQYQVRYITRYRINFHLIGIDKTNYSYSGYSSILSILVIFQFAVLVFSSCSFNAKRSPLSDKNDAFARYEGFLDSIEGDEKCSFKELPELLNRWKSLEDTVLWFIFRDTLEEHMNDIVRCSQIGSRVHRTVNHIIDGQVCGLDDLVKIQYGFPLLCLNQKQLYFQHEGELYFNGMDSNPVQPKKAKQVLSGYKNMLGGWSQNGFRTREDIMSFLKEEDYYYRLFLCNLYEYSSHDMMPFIHSPENLLARMAADVRKYSLDWNEISIYMAVRTNRRLIQNATACLSSLDQGILQTKRQAMLTVSMLLNPYADFNWLALAMRTSGQYGQLLEMSGKIPEAIHTMECKQLVSVLNIDSLSNKLIKEYIAFVMNH